MGSIGEGLPLKASALGIVVDELAIEGGYFVFNKKHLALIFSALGCTGVELVTRGGYFVFAGEHLDLIVSALGFTGALVMKGLDSVFTGRQLASTGSDLGMFGERLVWNG